jgi:hypothetical protein
MPRHGWPAYKMCVMSPGRWPHSPPKSPGGRPVNPHPRTLGPSRWGSASGSGPVCRAQAVHWTPPRAAGLCLLCFLSGCSHVPQQAVDLSQRMGQDLASVHTADRELARSHFATLRAQADAVVDKEYRPYVLNRAIEGTHLLAELDNARKPGAALDPLDIMQVFVEEAIARIDSFRTELHSPIDAQEREVLRRIDDIHQALAQGNAAITAHLISLRKVEKEQDTLMRRAGLPADTREQLISTIAGGSSAVEALLRKAKAGSAAMDSLPAEIGRAFAQ